MPLLEDLHPEFYGSKPKTQHEQKPAEKHCKDCVNAKVLRENVKFGATYNCPLKGYIFKQSWTSTKAKLCSDYKPEN